MSQLLPDQIISNRSDFLLHLNNELTKTQHFIEETTQSIAALEETVDNILTLTSKVEHQSLIPLGKNIYVPGYIKHTGEYFVDKLAFPNSFSLLETSQSTMKILKNQIDKKIASRSISQETIKQLTERINLLTVDHGETNDDNQPRKIVSDRGVAVKTGQFYEIIEFEP